jgi:hypothetical protein
VLGKIDPRALEAMKRLRTELDSEKERLITLLKGKNPRKSSSLIFSQKSDVNVMMQVSQSIVLYVALFVFIRLGCFLAFFVLILLLFSFRLAVLYSAFFLSIHH